MLCLGGIDVTVLAVTMLLPSGLLPSTGWMGRGCVCSFVQIHVNLDLGAGGRRSGPCALRVSQAVLGGAFSLVFVR